MWFDARNKLTEIVGQLPALPATLATYAPNQAKVSRVSRVSHAPTITDRPDKLDAETGAYLDYLRQNGPSTYGAMASAMGLGVTQAWQAEAKLHPAGLVTFQAGKSAPTPE